MTSGASNASSTSTACSRWRSGTSRQNRSTSPATAWGKSRCTARPVHKSDEGTLVDLTRSLVLQSVKRQLVADVPLGCFLSGGIDSSIVTAAMRQAIPADQPLLTFSIGFDDPRYDETAYAAAV